MRKQARLREKSTRDKLVNLGMTMSLRRKASELDDVVDLDSGILAKPSPPRRPSGTASRILRAVIPDALAAVERPQPEPLPVAQLLSRPLRDAITFALPRIDRSGRAYDKLIFAASGWQAGETLEIIATAHAVIFRPHPNGLTRVAPTKCITLPAAARHKFCLEAGDRVLLAAIESHRIVVAYPISTLDRALAALHDQPTR